MDGNTEAFIRLYNDFDDHLREKYHEWNRSNSMIGRYISQLERSAFTDDRERGRMINMIRILRNDLVHELDMNSEGVIEITDETIAFLEREIDRLARPLMAVSIMTPIARVFSARKEDSMRYVIQNMLEKGFTQVPVLNDDGRLFGVFSPNVLFRFMGNRKDDQKEEAGPYHVSDFSDLLPIDRHVSEAYDFVSKREDAEDLFSMFESASAKGRKLAVLFVTENGKGTEKILGMIVPYDIISCRNKAASAS